jgi:hypothetical protein
MTKQTPGHPASPITQATSLLDFFRDEFQLACDELGLETSQETEAYLVHLLDGYTRVVPENQQELGFGRPAAFMLGDAVHGAPGARIEAYRKLGDACLYNCGFFDARLTRRSVSSSYYEAMGRNAYDHVHGLMRVQGGAIQRNPFAQIFAELSNKFSGVVRAFKKLGGRTAPDDELRELVERFERGEVVDFAPLFTKK